MEPLLIIASAISQYIVPKALEKIGEKLGESALDKGRESIQSVRKIVSEKMKATNTEIILTQAQAQPTEANIRVLETVLVGEMAKDQEFAQQLQAMLDEIEARSPQLQSVLENIRIKGNAEVGNIRQTSRGSTQQTVGKNLGVGGDLKIGDITQES